MKGLMHTFSPGEDLGKQTWILDPADKYPDASCEEIIAACGLIPQFIDGADKRRAREQFEDRYPFMGDWYADDGSSVRGHCFWYPGDPPLPCYAVTRVGWDTVAIYPYGQVSITNLKGEHIHTRMD